MKKDKNIFIFMEILMGALVLIIAFLMIREKGDTDTDKVSVIIQDSDHSHWVALKYGLEMAAEDRNGDLFIVSTGETLNVEEERELIESEIDNGADAIIVQPVPGEESEEMLRKMKKKIDIMLVESSTLEDGTSKLSVTKPDNYAMGEALAKEVLTDYNGNLEGKLLGIVSEREDSEAASDRKAGFIDALEEAGGTVRWSIADAFDEEESVSLKDQLWVDIVIALDDDSLTEAAELSSTNNLHGAVVYGIGHSMEAFYYLDTGYAECLVVPDEFNVGYESMISSIDNIRKHSKKIITNEIEYTVIRKETLFTEENQNILFTMSQ